MKAYQNLPDALQEWLETRARTRNNTVIDRLQVALGPDDAFFAWDSASYRWSNIGEAMEKVIQSWITREGWSHGEPKCVTLGRDQAFFVITTRGAAKGSFGAQWTKLWNAWNKPNDFGNLNCNNVKVS